MIRRVQTPQSCPQRPFAFSLSTVNVSAVPTPRDLFPQECVRWPSSVQQNVMLWSILALQPPPTAYHHIPTPPPHPPLSIAPAQMWHLSTCGRQRNMTLIQYPSRFPLGLPQWHPLVLPWKVNKPTSVQRTSAPPILSAAPTFKTPAAVCLFYTLPTVPTLLTVCIDRKTLSRRTEQVHERADIFKGLLLCC